MPLLSCPESIRDRSLLSLVGIGRWVLCAWLTTSVVLAAEPGPSEYFFHHDHIVGTSLELSIVAPSEELADRADTAALAEIERLRLIFSAYDPNSELSRLNSTREPFATSADLLSVLRDYERWQARSGGAFNGQLGALVSTWQDAERRNELPTSATLAPIVAQLRQPGWQIDNQKSTVTRRTDQRLNLNSISKGYLLAHAAAAARAKVPTVKSLLINLGGDILAVGCDERNQPWRIGVQDPAQPSDNAPAITVLRLADQAVATSGGYQRYYTIQNRRYSHIFDPRTGQPATGVASATVVARDNITANALATTLCVLSPAEGVQLVEKTDGAHCLIIDDAGRAFRSAGFSRLEVPVDVQPLPTEFVAATNPWPKGFQMTIDVELPDIKSGKYRRPYVAVWLADAAGKPIRTLSVWGNSSKYLKDLSEWWKDAKGNDQLIKGVTRATRAPGKYQLVWDGKDDRGAAVPQGTYTVHVEVHREHGRHVSQTGKLECLDKAAETKLDKNAETEPTAVKYAPK